MLCRIGIADYKRRQRKTKAMMFAVIQIKICHALNLRTPGLFVKATIGAYSGQYNDFAGNFRLATCMAAHLS